jgi:hypothetical protein
MDALALAHAGASATPRAAVHRLDELSILAQSQRERAWWFRGLHEVRFRKR